MQQSVLSPIGVEITDLPIQNISTDSIDVLRGLLAEHGVAVLPDQEIDDVAFVAFLKRFGDLTFPEGETPVVGFPDLRTALYLSTPERCVAISRMGDAEGKDMIEFLYLHSTAEDNTSRHAWAAGDVVMWDNGCVLHRADHADVVGNRVMHRGMVTDYADPEDTGIASTAGV